MPARRTTSGASASLAAATSASRPWVSSPSASVCRNGSCTGAQPVVSTAGACAQVPPRQTSVVQASPSWAHASPSARGAPAMHPAASWPGSAGAQTAAVHASGGTQRLSIGTCWQPPAVQTSSVHEKPSSQPPPPAQSACGSVRSEEHTSELQSPCNLVCRLLLEKKKTQNRTIEMRPKQEENQSRQQKSDHPAQQGNDDRNGQ